MVQYNIGDCNGRVMLGMWLNSHIEAKYWLLVYCERYYPGKAFPNGKGVHPDYKWRIVTRRGNHEERL